MSTGARLVKLSVPLQILRDYLNRITRLFEAKTEGRTSKLTFLPIHDNARAFPNIKGCIDQFGSWLEQVVKSAIGLPKKEREPSSRTTMSIEVEAES
jgi:hypothetical protein